MYLEPICILFYDFNTRAEAINLINREESVIETIIFF